ncbi:hypothetical protein AALD22_22680 [Lachnospiraceae bacterium 56-18]|jgi:multidrug efflux pump subunit AcrA (membrane-fusion protein)|uniref:hypothetical protein n=1 Tax=Sporofaciens sp. JLR.KK001 TaxID=3112621 RepID=UPI002FF1F622
MNQNRKWILRIFGGFLAVMALGTVISRAAASALVAQVETEKAKRGKLSYSYEGEGTVVPVQEEQIFLWPEQQVEWTAKQGSTVKAGECLVQFRMEYLNQSVEKKQAELTQLELQASQQQISAREQARVPATTGAGQTLAQAQQQLELATQKEAAAQAAYEQFLQSAAAEETDPWMEQKQELEAAVQEAQTGVEAASQALAQAENGYELARQEDAAWDINAANASRAAMLGAEAASVQIEAERKELQRLQSYQAAGGKICAERDCTVLQAGVQAGAVTSGSEVFVTGSGGFRLKGWAKPTDREKLRTGLETEIQLGAGKKKTVKIESIETDTGGTGTGSGAGENAGDPASQSQIYWTSPLPENVKVQNGDSFTWSIEAPSEKEYEQIIPLEALREDMNEAYCLVLAEEEQMLGTVQVARRVPVTVLEKDARSAAVTSALTSDDQVIASSEKYVSEGDRVRLRE